MTTYLNRWTLAVAWIVLMSIVWSLFVPRAVSVTTFTLTGIVGLLVVFAGSALLSDSQSPQSMNQILSDLDTPSARPTRRT